MENFIDLHMHSIYSEDGEFTPTELVRMCRDTGLRIVSISDHNCVKANAEAQKEAERLDILYIPAVELDCNYRGIDLHVLGYQIDYTNRDFEDLEKDIMRQGLEASKERLELIRKLGFRISEEELNALSGKGYWNSWPGEIFAEVLLNKNEYMDHEILKPYREGGKRSDNPYVNFYWDFCAQGKPCYVEIKYPCLEETIALIRGNGGKAVLAHPGINLKGNYSIFDEIVALGIDGVEAFSSYHGASASHYFFQQALKHSLMFTFGSDFHGKTKPAIHLGETLGC